MPVKFEEGMLLRRHEKFSILKYIPLNERKRMGDIGRGRAKLTHDTTAPILNICTLVATLNRYGQGGYLRRENVARVVCMDGSTGVV